MIPNVVICEGPAVECDGNVPAFARVQANFLESLQVLHRPWDAGVRFAYVQFCNLGASMMPGIGHVKANADRLIARGMPGNDGKILVDERGVREPESEREQRLDPRSLKMSISQKQALRINNFLLGSSRIIAVLRAVVLPAALEGDGKFAGWTVFTKQQLGQGRAPFLSRIPSLQEPVHAI